MIRRNWIDERSSTDDGVASWLLISQVAHARISGEIVRQWREPYPDEVVEAVTHHDDGWARWEASPQFDPQRGRPLSFLEMPVADAIAIWNDSIESARRIGPLAGAIVAGHFIGLASGSDHAAKSPAKEWLEVKANDRTHWLSEWHRANAANTADAAAHAQQMLLAADLLSLWLCCDGPVTTMEAAAVPNAEMEIRAATVLGQYRFITMSKTITRDGVEWLGSVTPWPFAAASLDFTAPALAVPVKHYTTWREVAAAGREVQLRWQLRPTLPPSGEC